jgi:hypothetical protein
VRERAVGYKGNAAWGECGTTAYILKDRPKRRQSLTKERGTPLVLVNSKRVLLGQLAHSDGTGETQPRSPLKVTTPTRVASGPI